MRKGFYIVPVLFFTAADVAFAVIAWNSCGVHPVVFLAFLFFLAASLWVIAVRAGKSEKSSDTALLPSYWLTYLAGRISDVQDKDIKTGNHGDSFIFITDLHYNANDGYSAAAAEYIMNRSSVTKVVIGGDICNGSSKGKKECTGQILNCRNAFRKINPFYLRGNHDNNTEISGRSDAKTISDSELYGMILKPVEDRIVCNGELHYYFDNETQRIRYICLDTGHPDPCVISDEQIAWMQERIRELAPGWTVIVLTHQFYTAPGEKDENGYKIIAGLNGVFDETDAAIACVVCGHSHADYMETTDRGYPVICTTCDARGGEAGGLRRRCCTYTEQAFDVIHIDTDARKIYVTRIGAGEDRQAAY